ncbi:MAG: polysaccharide biosynthesis/export family protein [Paracoccaceae bacterium]|nr:polysaccharide biosynthesis/export family protein [Paracoccaceae bacterium]
MKSMVLAVLAIFAAAAAHAQGAFTVSAGDTLSIEVLEDSQLNRQVLVLPDGTINFPFAGSVPVAGRTVSQVESVLESAISPNFASTPNVFVTVREVEARPVVGTRTIDVFFLGEVNEPGTQAVPRGTTFLQALAMGGGLTPFAADKRVQLRRINPRTGAAQLVQINYRALTRGGALSRDIVLADGDVILVPSRGLFE